MWTTSGETRNKDAWYTVRPERADARPLAGEANQHAQRHEHEMAMMYLDPVTQIDRVDRVCCRS